MTWNKSFTLRIHGYVISALRIVTYLRNEYGGVKGQKGKTIVCSYEFAKYGGVKGQKEKIAKSIGRITST